MRTVCIANSENFLKILQAHKIYVAVKENAVAAKVSLLFFFFANLKQ